MDRRKSSDWGCLGWFILAFLIFAALVFLVVLSIAPSGGDGKSCESRSYVIGSDRGLGHTLRSVSNVSLSEVHHPGGRSGGTSGRGSSSTSRWGVRPKPVKPNLVKPAKPRLSKTTKPPQGGSGGHHKPSKVEIDLGDCD